MTDYLTIISLASFAVLVVAWIALPGTSQHPAAQDIDEKI